MWLCVLQLLLLVTTSKWTWATPEEAYAPVPPESDDSKDGSMIVFLEGRSLFGNSHQTSDIEARRRSAFEKNFMRFGRARSGPIPNDDMTDEEEFVEDMDRAARSQNKNDNFIRFGRGSSDFIRFGRAPFKYVQRSDPEKENNFIRFGRSVAGAHKRSRRSANDKRPSGNNIVRFGRNDNFMRFGRGENEENADAAPDGKIHLNARQSNPLVAHLRLHDPMLLHLLTEIAAKIKSEKSNWMRLSN